MQNIFKIIKSIQKIDRKILPHAEKNLLISIAIHLGENGHIWPTNEQMGERIGESKDYVKNLLMRLKNKKYIAIEGRGKSRKIKIIEDTIFGNSQLPNHANGNSQLPIGNSQLPKSALPIKRKEKKKIKEKSGKKPSADFLKKLELWRSIPIETRKLLNKKQVVKCSIEKIEYAIERMNVTIKKGGNPVKAFQNALKGDHAKLTRIMEAKAMAEKKEHDIDIVKMAEEMNRKKANEKHDKEKLLALVPAFKDSIFGERYKNHGPLAIIELRSFQSFVAYS